MSGNGWWLLVASVSGGLGVLGMFFPALKPINDIPSWLPITIAVIALIVGPFTAFRRLRARLRQVESGMPRPVVTWSEKKQFTQALSVKNLGSAASFSANIELLSSRNLVKDIDGPETYKPVWNESDGLEVKILHNDSRHLLIAQTKPITEDGKVRAVEFGFYHQTRDGTTWEPQVRWNAKLQQAAPVFEFRVILSTHPVAENPYEKTLQIECFPAGCRMKEI